jgi:hypothetical protein
MREVCKERTGSADPAASVSVVAISAGVSASSWTIDGDGQIVPSIVVRPPDASGAKDGERSVPIDFDRRTAALRGAARSNFH